MDPVVILIISIAMSLMFGAGAANKLRAWPGFRSAVETYRLMPTSLSGMISIVLLTLESLAAVLAPIPPTRQLALTTMAVLLLLYTAGIGINLYRGRREMDCGCGGAASRHPISGWLMARNLLLLGFVLLASIPASTRPLNWLDLLVTTFGVLIAGGLYMGTEQLLSQAPRLARLRSQA